MMRRANTLGSRALFAEQAGADDAASPIYNCVVRFKVLRGAAEAAGRGDGTQCDARDAADALERALAGKLKDKKFLLILTPSDLELYAARDFCREGDEDGCAAGPVTTAVTAGGNFLLPAFIRSATGLPCDPLTLANAKAVDAAIKLVGKVASTLRLPSGSSPPAPPAAASPSPSSPPAPTAEELEADEVVTLSVALSQVVAVRQAGASALLSFRRQKPRVRLTERAGQLLKPWEKDPEQNPYMRTCMLALPDEAAAAELVAAIASARRQLASAVQWVSRGLPLLDKPVAMQVQVQGGGGAAAEVLADAAACEWGSPIAVPPRWMQPAGGGDHPDASFTVLLHTPLGPAAAVLSAEQLAGAWAAGQRPVTVKADPLLPGPAAQEGQQRLRVLLQASMSQEEAKDDDVAAEEDCPAAAAGREDQQHTALLAAASVVAMAAAWMQLFLSGERTGSATLQWAVLVACSAAALLALLLLLLPRRRKAPAAVAGQQPRWLLTLLRASLVAPGAEVLLDRAVAESESGAAAEAGAEAAAKQLPAAFRQLLIEAPDVVDANMAGRFLATYTSAPKAYAALQQCVAWRREQGMVNLLGQAHPSFELIKRLYPHAVLGWSKKKDCMVTLDSYGVWKASYEALKKEGVSEQELLRHLVLCFDFYFTQLDTRLWPEGNVNICDLGGLKMSDAAGEAFRFISKVGALLNLHFPGRLHRAFLINAPSWWSIVWRLISPLISAQTRELMAVFPISDKEGARQAMLEWIDADVLPEEYGGTSTAGLYESDLEQRFWEHVRARNRELGSGGSKEGGGSQAAPAASEPAASPAQA